MTRPKRSSPAETGCEARVRARQAGGRAPARTRRVAGHANRARRQTEQPLSRNPARRHGTELVHDAACSVLLACPADSSPWQPRKIVVGLDGSTYAFAALRRAEEIARAFGSAVEVVAATGGKPVERDADWSERVIRFDPADPVAALVERSRTVDLVVVGSRGVHGLRALGSVSERVAHQAHCTALVVHEPKAESSA